MPHFAKMLSHQKTFDEMLARFNISARDIGETAGVSEVMVSRFRHGKTDLTSDKLFALLRAVPPEAREWYLSQTFPDVKVSGFSLRSLIANASQEEKAEVLVLIANWVQEISNN